MAIIDKRQKISDTVWELPATYKEGMRGAGPNHPPSSAR
jgi:hypothetical protein